MLNGAWGGAQAGPIIRQCDGAGVELGAGAGGFGVNHGARRADGGAEDRLSLRAGDPAADRGRGLSAE